MNNIEELWPLALNQFHTQFSNIIDKISFDSYFSDLKIKKVVNDDVYVTCDTQWAYEYDEEYIDDLSNVLSTLAGYHLNIIFSTEEDFNTKYNIPVVHNENKVIFDDHLNPDMTFDTFVIGNCNRFAQNAALAVAMKPGFAYSPLFIHSNSGLGKTHLLNAIGNYTKSKNTDINVLYMTCEDFVNNYINALKNNTIDSFQELYHNIDVLLIDDIQFIASKESSSEVFFNIFNNLIRKKKQIVITSDKPPRELKGMENRLVSRFASGLTVSIDPPTFETSKAIIKKKIELRNIDTPINEEVIDFIASHFSKDVRDIEGSINRLLFYSLICEKDVDVIDLNFALEAFTDDFDTSKPQSLTIDEIKKCVASYYNLTVNQINSKSRISNITVARHIAMYLVRNLIPDTSFIQIGQEFGGRDHATVMKACTKVADKIKSDPNYEEAINKIKNKLI